jgi:hypothetical protein
MAEADATSDFNAAAPKPRMVTIPAHTAHVFDWMSYRDDGMQGLHKGRSQADLDREYKYDRDIPEQTIAYISDDKLPFGMEHDTRLLLKKIMAAEDRAEEERVAHILKDKIVLSPVIRFKGKQKPT